jgi:hypothetical protein
MLKKIVIMALLPLSALAQNGIQGMSQADMQQMMQQAEKMQACMAQVDQEKMQAMAERSKAMEAEIKELCSKGDRTGAERLAFKYGREISNDPEMQKARECGKMMKGMRPPMPLADRSAEPDKNRRHICDD